nr:putative L-asparaginase [uncultured bacterium]
MQTLQAKNDDRSRQLVILGTGGTIAGRADCVSDNVGYVSAQVGAGDLVAAIPALSRLPIEVEQVAQLDSCNMDFSTWQLLARRVAFHLQRPEVDGIVITHGTDTLEETAYFLQAVLQPAKAVVLTCAMRPSTALVPDGPQNLVDAVAVAHFEGASGVTVVCDGQIHLARDVTKAHSYRLDAFDSGDAGALGCVEEGQIRLFRDWERAAGNAPFDAAALRWIEKPLPWPRVELLFSHAGADGALVRALLAQGRENSAQALRGLVVAGTGNGSLHEALVQALLEAQAQGVRVVRATRCARGRVISHARSAFPDSAGLTPVKARIALMLDLLQAKENPA